MSTPEWEVEILRAIRHEIERKLARTAKSSMDESATPWSNDDEEDLMGELESRKRRREMETESYQAARAKSRRRGSESPHPEDTEQQAPVKIPELFVQEESEIETEVDTPPPLPTADKHLPTDSMETHPPDTDEMQVDLAGVVASFERERDIDQ